MRAQIEAPPCYSRDTSGSWTLKQCQGCGQRKTMPVDDAICGVCQDRQACEMPLYPPPRERPRLALRGLATARRKAGCSQTLVCSQVRINPRVLSRYENVRALATPSTALALAEVLDVSLRELEVRS